MANELKGTSKKAAEWVKRAALDRWPQHGNVAIVA